MNVEIELIVKEQFFLFFIQKEAITFDQTIGHFKDHGAIDPDGTRAVNVRDIFDFLGETAVRQADAQLKVGIGCHRRSHGSRITRRIFLSRIDHRNELSVTSRLSRITTSKVSETTTIPPGSKKNDDDE